MPAHPESTWSSNGAGRGNLFVDADPDVPEIGSSSTTGSLTTRRGRGLMAAIEDSTVSPERTEPPPDSAVRSRTARTLPERLSTSARTRIAVRALFKAAPREQRGARASGVSRSGDIHVARARLRALARASGMARHRLPGVP